MDNAWILIGMMGAGKSTIGGLLAELSGRKHYDTDRLLQHRLGRSIPQLFSIYGEDAFRDHETSILRSLPVEPSVISTGGGIVIRPQNWDEMHRLGSTIFMDLDPALIKSRLEASKKRRPLLEVEEWEERFERILDGRRHLYEQADLHIRVPDVSLEECAQLIYMEIRERGL